MPDAKGHQPERAAPSTRGADYADRLIGLQTVWWKRLLPVQAPYRYNIRRLGLGRTLDVGCGLGRNLAHLGRSSVGVDHNAQVVAYCRAMGLTAYVADEFARSPAAVPEGFDSMLLAHVVEHLDEKQVDQIMSMYLPYVRPRGHVLFVTPQELGYRSDPTHVRFVDFRELTSIAQRHGLSVERSYSFPFPRMAGRSFKYNEFNVLAIKP